MINQRGFSVVQIGSVLLGLIILGVCLPIIDPFLALGIGATGGVAGTLLAAFPLFLVGALIMYLFREQPPQQAGW